MTNCYRSHISSFITVHHIFTMLSVRNLPLASTFKIHISKGRNFYSKPAVSKIALAYARSITVFLIQQNCLTCISATDWFRLKPSYLLERRPASWPYLSLLLYAIFEGWPSDFLFPGHPLKCEVFLRSRVISYCLKMARRYVTAA